MQRGQSREDYARDLKLFLLHMDAQGVRSLAVTGDYVRLFKEAMVLAGMKLPYSHGADYRRRFESMYREVAKARGVRLMPFLLEGVAGRPAYNIADGLHPNEKGHRIMAKNVQAFLKKEGLLP